MTARERAELRRMTEAEIEQIISVAIENAFSVASDWNVEARLALAFLVGKGIITPEEITEGYPGAAHSVRKQIEEHVRDYIAKALA